MILFAFHTGLIGCAWYYIYFLYKPWVDSWWYVAIVNFEFAYAMVGTIIILVIVIKKILDFCRKALDEHIEVIVENKLKNL